MALWIHPVPARLKHLIVDVLAMEFYVFSFYIFHDYDKNETGGIQRNTLYVYGMYVAMERESDEKKSHGDRRTIQCVFVNSTSFVIYPDLEATEVRFSALKTVSLLLLFQDR